MNNLKTGSKNLVYLTSKTLKNAVTVASDIEKTGLNITRKGVETTGKITISALNASGKIVNKTLNTTVSTTGAISDIVSNTSKAVSGIYSEVFGQIGDLANKRRQVRKGTKSAKVEVDTRIETLQTFKRATKKYTELITTLINLHIKNLKNIRTLLKKQHRSYIFKPYAENATNITTIDGLINRSLRKKAVFLSDTKTILSTAEAKLYGNLNVHNTLNDIAIKMKNKLAEIETFYNNIAKQLNTLDRQ